MRRNLLSSYRREKDCAGAAYAAARRYASSELEELVANLSPSTGRVMDNARFRLELAQAASRKRCFQTARQTYTEVIDIFTGPPYAALKRRAETGIARLPTMASSDPG
ncbi:MAG TPA: hypothetical protein VE690_10550 [Rhodopila sp.]|nr:hypothetical protein [Rhodopila sp.]